MEPPDRLAALLLLAVKAAAEVPPEGGFPGWNAGAMLFGLFIPGADPGYVG
jgi:hypothetical protein